ncbi:MAG: hypothetical protein SPLM_08920 [Spiroplasma phoeniceum]|uniref:hypothetical protein n=1 Tax=Spiroplasma phoeniceum TaxID=47835 RepID=UPI0031342007
MYTCERCNKKYETDMIPHFLESYFCNDCFVKGQREKVQEQIMLMDNNLDQKELQDKINEIYNKHNKNVLQFLEKDKEKNKELIKNLNKLTKK